MSRKPNLTPGHTAAQTIAADPTQPVWVSANAGTGKTHVLIERILRLLLAGTPPGKILCLTYTKAAAAEVATRLSTRLGHWAAGGGKALARDLKKLLGNPASEKEAERAGVLFAATLETPEGLRIRTIHSFCESLLGRFPVEARLAPHFSVLDERQAREIRIEARNRLLAGGAAAGKTGAALSHLAGMLNAEDFSKLMADLGKEREKLRRGIARAGGLEGLIAETRRGLGLQPGDTRDTVLAAASADVGAFDGKALEKAAGALDEGTKTEKDRAAQIRGWLENEAPQRAQSFLSVYAPIFLTQGGGPRKSLMTKKPKEAHPEALAALLAEQERVMAVLDRLKAVTLAEATAALLVVGMALIDEYDGIKRTRALLDYDDLIEKAGKLLDSGDGVSWVHYKLDGGIDHILVDEAQDTSPPQWEVIKRLAGDFYAGEGAGDRPLGRTVFAVGDEKQSIYSFQDADPAYFGLMRDHFRDLVSGAGERLQEVELERSYRSAPAVLAVVDEVFAAAADGLTWDSKPIRHHTHRDGQGGLVELWPALSPEDVANPVPWDAPLDQMSTRSPETRLIERIADRIAGWLGSGEILESAGRPITPGDIMILVRTRGSFADRMVGALKRRGIGVTGRDRLKLMDHLAVMDLAAAGRFALLPDDDLNTAVVLKGPFVEFDDDVLFGLAHNHGQDRKQALWRVLQKRRDEKPQFAAAWETLSRLLAAADRTPPYEFYASLLGPGGGRRDLIAHLGSEAGEPIDEFLGLALDFERDHQPSLEGFLHWLESGETEVKREMESGRDEVRVLTVHGAKGLEAPIVFLPDTCTLPGERMDPHIHWAGNGDGEGDGNGDGEFVLWRPSKNDEEKISADLHERARRKIEQEYRRLLYVAMTRARDRLYLSGWYTGKNPKDGCWYGLIEPAMHKMGEEVTLESGETVWRRQSPQKAEPDGEAGSVPTAETKHLPDWASTPPPPEPEPSRPLTPSRPDREEPPIISPLGSDGGARFKRGLLVHRLLQSLPDLPVKERKAAAKQFLSRPALGLSPGERDDLINETLGVMEHPDLAALFGPGSLAEVPLTGVIGNRSGGAKDGESRVISGQLDRLLVTGDAVTVIDYKTNRPPPQTEDAVDPAYLRQMAAYRELLREIYPGRPVRAVLLWTVGPRMMALGDDILDAHAP